MICTPESRKASPALALALAGAALTMQPAAPAFASPLQEAAELVARARADLSARDGIAAEARLKQAMERGAAREAVAAYMGEALILQGELDRARDWLAPGRFTRRTAVLGFRTLARLEQLQGDLPAAGAAFDRVIGLAPKDPTVWVEIARLRYAGGEHMLALDAAEYAFELDPANVRVLELRGQFVRDQYGLIAALPWFEAALARAPDDVSVLGEYAATLGELGRAREMLAVTRRMLELDPGNARAYYLQAVLAARAGKFDLARGLMNRTGNRLEGMPAAQLLAGVLHLQTGNHILASEAFESLVRRQPENEKARLLLVRALFLSGEYRQLVLRFGDAAADANASPYLLTVLARAYEALGERALAAPLLDRAALARAFGAARPGGLVSWAPPRDAADADTAADSGNFDVLARAGDARLALGQGAAALERYRLAARVRLPEGLMLRMVAAHRLEGQQGAAAALIASLLAQHPGSEAAAWLAAELAADSGDWKRARLLLENLRANGGARDVRVLTDLSLAQLRDGDAKAAASSARAAYRLQRANPLAAQALGLSLAALGEQRRTAAALLARAQRQFGATPLIAEGLDLLGRHASG